MGFFSKLFKETGLDELAKNVSEAVGDLKKEFGGETAPQTAQSSFDETVQSAAGPSGFSWGEVMPAEENQFNYHGTYLQYFEEIFRSEFAAYDVSRETVSDGNRHIFTFTSGGRKALVVELMPQSSASRKLRENCRREGTPYLRYYYDHEGWWNTRSYVTERTRKALGA
ncbi:MAG: hypothetical protein IJS22_01250 [Lachnospiraceae bacterium]|nr:hypothetical protein [Lachnospiraceae bacterium]